MAEFGHALTGSETLRDWSEQSSDWAGSQIEQMTDEGQAAFHKPFFEEDENGSIRAGSAWSDPRTLTLQAASLAGQIVPQFAGGGGLGSGARLLVGKAFVKAKLKDGLKKGLSKEAAVKQAEASLRHFTNSAGQGVAGAAITGGMLSNETRDEINAMSDADLDESQEYRRIFWKLRKEMPNVSTRELRDLSKRTLADRVGKQVALDPQTLATNVVLDTVQGKFIDDFLRGAGTGNRLTNSALQATGQGLTEAGQGASEQYVQNKAMRDAGFDVGRWDNVAVAGLNEGVVGGALGGVIGAARKGKGYQGDKPQVQPEQSQTEQSQPKQSEPEQSNSVETVSREEMAANNEQAQVEYQQQQRAQRMIEFAQSQFDSAPEDLKKRFGPKGFELVIQNFIRDEANLPEGQKEVIEYLQMREKELSDTQEQAATSQEQPTQEQAQAESMEPDTQAQPEPLAPQAESLPPEQPSELSANQVPAEQQGFAEHVDEQLGDLSQYAEDVDNENTPSSHQHTDHELPPSRGDITEPRGDNGQTSAEILNRDETTTAELDGATATRQAEQATEAEQTVEADGGESLSDATPPLQQDALLDSEVSSGKEIKQAFDKAAKGDTTGKPIPVGRLTQKGREFLENISGLKLKQNVSFNLNPSDLKHIYNDHYGDNEKDKGNNIPLTDSDIENMASVISRPDEVVFLGYDKKKQSNKFAFLKASDNGTYNLVEVYGNKKGNLTAKTFFKTKRDVAQRVMDLGKSLLSTSKTYFGKRPKESIPVLFESFKETGQHSDVTDADSVAKTETQSKNTQDVPATEKKATLPKEKIEDTGEKLGGARKDEFQAVRDKLKDMPDEDIAKQTNAKLFPKSAVNKIEDPLQAAFYDSVRASLPNKPRKPHQIRLWVKQVKQARAMIDEFAGERLSSLVEKSKDNPALKSLASRTELLSKLPREDWGRIGSVNVNPDRVLVDIDKRLIRFEGKHSIQDALADIQEKLSNKPEKAPAKGGFEIRSTRDSVFINKKGDREYRRLKEFDDVDSARAYLKDNTAELTKAWEAVKKRDNVSKSDVRDGENGQRLGKDHRDGKDMTAESFAKTFGFRGVEFGNWVNNQERQSVVNDAYDALMDLAELIGIPATGISLEGRLGLGFGSRGRGGRANAHYEPDRLVINLTKTKGAGSLAHEWFHALDNYFSSKRGDTDFITNQPEPMMVNKVHLYKVTKDTFLKGQKKEQEQGVTDGAYNSEKWRQDTSHKSGVRPEIEEAFGDLVRELNDSPMSNRAAKIDKTPDAYWSKIIERAARAFETYVISKMDDKGVGNDFLANVTPIEDFKRNPDRYPYLTEDEQVVVDKAFDKLFKTLKHKTEDGKTILFSRKKENLSDTDSFKATEERTGGEEAYERAKADGKTKLNYHQWIQVRTPEFKAWFGDWEKANSDEVSKVVDPDTGEPLVVYHGTAYGGFVEFRDDIRKKVEKEKGIFFSDSYDAALQFASGRDEEINFDGYFSEVLEEKGRDNIIQELENLEVDEEYEVTTEDLILYRFTKNEYGEIDVYINDGGVEDEITLSDPQEITTYIQQESHVYRAFLNIKTPEVYDASNVKLSELSEKTLSLADEVDGHIWENATDRYHHNPYTIDDVVPITATQIIVFHPNQIKSATDNNGEFNPLNDSILKSQEPDKPKATANTKKPTSESVSSHLEQVKSWHDTASKAFGIKAEVVADVEHLPREIRALMPKDDVPEGFYYKGKAYLIASEIHSYEDAVRVYLHEAIGHGAVIELLQKQEAKGGKPVLDMLDDMAKQVGRVGIERNIKRYGFDFSDAKQRREATLEYIAHLAETGKKPDALQKIIIALRDFIRQFFNLAWPDTDTLALIERAKRVNQAKQSPASKKSNFNQQAFSSLSEAPNSEFAKAVDIVAQGKVSRGYVKMGTTPNVLKLVGMPDTAIRVKETVLEKAMGEYLGVQKGKYRHIHNLTPDILKQLPKQINDPVAVFNSTTTDNAYVVLTELAEVDTKRGVDKPVIVALHVKQGKNGIDVIDVASAYGRSNKQLETAFRNDLRYLNKEKAQQFLNTVSLLQESEAPNNSAKSPALVSDFISDVELSNSDVRTEKDLTQDNDVKFSLAYHGSPYSFDRFDYSHMGSGEGNQAFGWGGYFTDKESIARGYAKMGGDNNPLIIKFNGEVVGKNGKLAYDEWLDDTAKQFAHEYIVSTNGDKQKAIDFILDTIKKTKHKTSIPIYEESIGIIKNAEIEVFGGRNLYKVKIHGDKTIDELHFMRWDKPFSKQPKKIRDLLNNISADSELKSHVRRFRDNDQDGKYFYQQFSDNPKETSLQLLKAGIDGIQYPTDSHRRGSHEDSFNYVVFDENAVEIDKAIRFSLPQQAEVTQTEQRTGGKEAYERAKAQGKTKLSYKQWVQVRTPEFKAWFGDWEKANSDNVSKVVDPDTGEPLVVYHGTPENFTTFDIDQPIRNGRGEGVGFYFINDKKIAEKYATSKGRVMPAFLSLKKPFKGFDGLSQENKKTYLDATNDEEAYNKLGIDGFIVGGQHIVKNPNQIKSATDNNGDFNPLDDSILKSVKRRIDDDTTLTEAQKTFLGGIGSEHVSFKERASERIAEIVHRLAVKLRAANVDRYAAFLEMDKKLIDGEITSEENITSSAWVRARMSNVAGGVVSALMNTGRIFLDNEGVIEVRKNTRGLVYSLAKLGDAKEVERFFGWIVANRAEKLAKEDKEFLFSAQDIEAGKTLNQGKLDDGRNRVEVYQEVFKEFQQHRNDVLMLAEQAGIIKPKDRASWENEFYVPFYRVFEKSGEPSFSINQGGLTRQQAFKQLKGSKRKIQDPLHNTLMNFHHLIDASMKNLAAKHVIVSAVKLGAAKPLLPQQKTSSRNITYILKEGKRIRYEITDDLTYKALEALGNKGLVKAKGKDYGIIATLKGERDIDDGTLEQSKEVERKIKIHVNFYSLIINQVPQVLLDTENMIANIMGKDYLADMRNHLL